MLRSDFFVCVIKIPRGLLLFSEVKMSAISLKVNFYLLQSDFQKGKIKNNASLAKYI